MGAAQGGGSAGEFYFSAAVPTAETAKAGTLGFTGQHGQGLAECTLAGFSLLAVQLLQLGDMLHFCVSLVGVSC